MRNYGMLNSKPSNPAQQIESLCQKLCAGESLLIRTWLTSSPAASLKVLLPMLIISTALFGAAMGARHSNEMSLYVSIKFPAIILLTLLFNAMLNGIFAALGGSGISVRQSIQFLLIGFTIFGLILASLSPILYFMALHSASVEPEETRKAYAIFLTSNVGLIAFAGLASHHILLKHVKEFATTPIAGTLTFLSWVAINFFVGAEITYLLRPFFGAPGLEADFLRPDMLDGNFYEVIYRLIKSVN